MIRSRTICARHHIPGRPACPAHVRRIDRFRAALGTRPSGGVTASARYPRRARPVVPRRACPGRPGLGRRRSGVRRPEHVVRGVTARSRQPGRRRGGDPGDGARDHVRLRDRCTGPSRRADRRGDPSAELVRFAGSGTETTWHALRTAKVATGRTKVVKFEGHFHGFNDSLGYSFWPSAEEAGPGISPRAVPESAGMPAANADHTFGCRGTTRPRSRRSSPPTNPNRRRRDGAGELGLGDDPARPWLPGGCPRRDPPAPRRAHLRSKSSRGSGPASGEPKRNRGSPRRDDARQDPRRRDSPVRVRPLRRDARRWRPSDGPSTGTYNAHLIPVMVVLAFLDQLTDATFYPHLLELGDAFYP